MYLDEICKVMTETKSELPKLTISKFNEILEWKIGKK